MNSTCYLPQYWYVWVSEYSWYQDNKQKNNWLLSFVMDYYGSNVQSLSENFLGPWDLQLKIITGPWLNIHAVYCWLNQHWISISTKWQVLKNKWFNIIFYDGKNVKRKNLFIFGDRKKYKEFSKVKDIQPVTLEW